MIEVSAFRWVPPFAEGYVRDLRFRWALDETGLPYEAELIGHDTKETQGYREWARSQQLCHEPPLQAAVRQVSENAQFACTPGRSGLPKITVLGSSAAGRSSRIRQNAPSSDPGFAL